jgi:hypothetical protein
MRVATVALTVLRKTGVAITTDTQDIENAYTWMLKSNVKHRFLIDLATLKAA